jgi:flagellar FliJ protein
MPQRFSLQTLLDLSQLRLDTATKRLGELIAGEQEAQKRYELLVEYRSEYQARFVAAAQNGLAPREWQNFQGFLLKLDDAINQANLMVSQSRSRTAHGQREWIAKRGNLKAFDTLAQRHRDREQVTEVRNEQRDLDEFGSRKIDDSSSHGNG